MNNQLIQRENNLKSLFANKTKMIQSILGDKEKANKFTATALQVALNKDLISCSEESIVNCAMGVAMLDLSLDKNIGQAYLIKYGQECTLQVGYKGWLNLLYRAGYEMRTFPVFKCDEFSVNFDGWDMNYKLNPDLENRDIGNFDWEFENLEGIIVAAKDLSTGEIKRDFVSKAIIEKMRKSSPNQKTNIPTFIWKDWYIDMCQKSAIKKFKNQIALRDELSNIAIADTLENNKTIDFEKTKKQGVVIEAQIEEKAKGINEVHNDVSSDEIIKEKLLKQGFEEAKVLEFININIDKIDTYLEDEEQLNNDAMEYFM